MRSCEGQDLDRIQTACLRAPQTWETQHLCDWLEAQAWMMDAWIDDAMERSRETDVVVALCEHRAWLRARIDEFRSRARQQGAVSKQ
jgi:hypothetical protein